MNNTIDKKEINIKFRLLEKQFKVYQDLINSENSKLKKKLCKYEENVTEIKNFYDENIENLEQNHEKIILSKDEEIKDLIKAKDEIDLKFNDSQIENQNYINENIKLKFQLEDFKLFKLSLQENINSLFNILSEKTVFYILNLN